MGRKRIVTINKSIVEVIVAELLLGGTESAEDEQEADKERNQNNGRRLKSGDRGMQVFVPQHTFYSLSFCTYLLSVVRF